MWYHPFRMLYMVCAHVRLAHRSIFINVASTPPLYTMVRMSPANNNTVRRVMVVRAWKEEGSVGIAMRAG